MRGRKNVSFSVSVDRPELFSPRRTAAPERVGDAFIHPRLLASGSATVTVTARDDGGVANGGLDSVTSTFKIFVLPRNHPPTLQLSDVTALEDSGAQSAQAVAAVGPGAGDELGQTVSLSLSTNHPEFFTTQPSLSNTGLLTFTPAADAFGTATATVTARDDGGTANGGYARPCRPSRSYSSR